MLNLPNGLLIELVTVTRRMSRPNPVASLRSDASISASPAGVKGWFSAAVILASTLVLYTPVMASPPDSVQRDRVVDLCIAGRKGAAPGTVAALAQRWKRDYGQIPAAFDCHLADRELVPCLDVCAGILDPNTTGGWIVNGLVEKSLKSRCTKFSKNPCAQALPVACSQGWKETDQGWLCTEFETRGAVARCDDVVGQIARDQCAAMAKDLTPRTSLQEKHCAACPDCASCRQTASSDTH